MAYLSVALFLWSAICGCCLGRALDSSEIVAKRDVGSGEIPSELGKSLYWFGNFSVGDSGYVRLLIDTGSSDLWLNKGVYKASEYEKPYSGNSTFSITYEGVNRAGFGFETVNGTVQNDVVTAGGLTVEEQTMGNCTSWKYIDVPQLPYADQGQGIIGFHGPGSSSFLPGARSWFYNLCYHNIISEHRFGLAFGTSGKGLTIVGKLAKRLITGEMVAAERVKGWDGYTVVGDFTLNNSIILLNQTIIMDVGTDNIQGPITETRMILDKLGYQTNLLSQKQNSFDPGHISKTLLGYFDCSNPPTIGFSFPAQSQLKPGQKAKNFNVSPLVWDVYRHKSQSNNCTSILGGTNALTNPATGGKAWLLGQSFFAGKYIDFDNAANTISYADLEDPTMSSAF